MNNLLERYVALEPGFKQTAALQPCLRVNTLHAPQQETLRRLKKTQVSLRKIPFLQHGYMYQADFSLGATPLYLQGAYYLQEAASQIPVEVLNPRPGETVLDMAAAPGGKTTHLAQHMDNQGIIVALESNTHRLPSLANNVERMGVTNTVVYKKDARFAFDLGTTYDKILLDAPCSGNFAIEPHYFEKRSLSTIRQRARLQKELLKAALKCLKPGGTLVYSTCSLEPEENELLIHWLLEKKSEVLLKPIPHQVGDPGLVQVFGKELESTLALCKRFWPHKTGTQGFFIAKLVRT